MTASSSALLVSSAIKSWREAERRSLESALAAGIQSLAGTEGVVVDIWTPEEPIRFRSVMNELGGSRRSPASSSVGSRFRRALGVTTLKDGTHWRAAVPHLERLTEIFDSGVLWAADFVIYPAEEADADHPDPITDEQAFEQWARWSLAQRTGLDGWWITALGPTDAPALAKQVVDCFQRAGLTASVSK